MQRVVPKGGTGGVSKTNSSKDVGRRRFRFLGHNCGDPKSGKLLEKACGKVR